MPEIWKAGRHWLWISALCAGCTAQSPLAVPASTPTMIEIYQRHMLSESTPDRDTHRREDRVSGETVAPTETQQTRNPVIHMYVFPHRSKAHGLLLPGYWTSFELYERFKRDPDRSVD